MPRFPYGDAGSREAAIAAFRAAFDMNEANSEEALYEQIGRLQTELAWLKKKVSAYD